jgi:hypothetical protein
MDYRNLSSDDNWFFEALYLKEKEIHGYVYDSRFPFGFQPFLDINFLHVVHLEIKTYIIENDFKI